MTAQNILLFRKWDISQIEIKDPGLKALWQKICQKHWQNGGKKNSWL